MCTHQRQAHSRIARLRLTSIMLCYGMPATRAYASFQAMLRHTHVFRWMTWSGLMLSSWVRTLYSARTCTCATWYRAALPHQPTMSAGLWPHPTFLHLHTCRAAALCICMAPWPNWPDTSYTRGLSLKATFGRRYAPSVEEPVFHFHKLVHKDLIGQ